MKIYLIRHGQTTADVEDRYGGAYDDHLTDLGKKQAQELAGKLKGSGIEVIYHSPMIRATETARIITNDLSLELRVVPDLRERNVCGVVTGLTKTEARERFPDQVEELSKGTIYPKVKGSEQYNPFKERVLKAFGQVTSSDYSTIAVITHGGPISCIVRELLRLGELKRLGDCAILEIDKNGKRYKLVNMDNAELEKR
ncbi:histidine phosphatase family protein [archaeon]|nr:histidine phosphatase family protein [archaeon]